MSTASCTTTSKFRHVRLSGVASIIALLLTPALYAESAEVLAKKLGDVAASSSLSAVGKPWHLKMSVTVFDSKGASQDGTVESWRAGEESHTIASLQGGSITEYDHANEHYYSTQGSPVPQVVFDVLDAVLHPGPEPYQFTGTTPQLETHDFGKTRLDCIMLSRDATPTPGRITPPPPLGLFPTYCLVPKSDRLELFYSFGNPTVLRTGFGKFAGQDITTSVSITNGATALANGKVLSLSTFTPAEGEFTPPAELRPVGSHTTKIASGIIAGAKTGGAVPQYPASARMAHISGSVVLRAIIGSDGHIQHLTVMSTGDWDLAVAALLAVRTWTYKPYLLNGEPTAIDTTITVNFNLS